jgi:two-component system OmpR family response regulator
MKAEFETLTLTKMQRKLLLYLADNFGECVTKDRLLVEVWGLHENTLTRSIDTYVCVVRKAILPLGYVIQNKRGAGYVLDRSPSPAERVDQTVHGQDTLGCAKPPLD